MRCLFRNINCKCKLGGKCPFAAFEDAAIRCSQFVPNDASLGKTAAIKTAKWADVKAKAEAIVEAGGVEIISESTTEVNSYVMSGDVADRFPVKDGGPYEVILSKKSWENKSNVGGWLQGWVCSCDWGYYHGGEPGTGWLGIRPETRWSGRLCSHAYATMIVCDIRGRKDFIGDRKQASRNNGYLFSCLAKALFSPMRAARGMAAHELEKVATLREIDNLAKQMIVKQENGVTAAICNGNKIVFKLF